MDHRPQLARGVERARWLAELDRTLEEASDIVCRLHAANPSRPEAADLRLRVQEARDELEGIRRRAWACDAHEVHPKWTNLRGTPRRHADPDQR